MPSHDGPRLPSAWRHRQVTLEKCAHIICIHLCTDAGRGAADSHVPYWLLDGPCILVCCALQISLEQSVSIQPSRCAKCKCACALE